MKKLISFCIIITFGIAIFGIGYYLGKTESYEFINNDDVSSSVSYSNESTEDYTSNISIDNFVESSVSYHNYNENEEYTKLFYEAVEEFKEKYCDGSVFFVDDIGIKSHSNLDLDKVIIDDQCNFHITNYCSNGDIDGYVDEYEYTLYCSNNDLSSHGEYYNYKFYLENDKEDKYTLDICRYMCEKTDDYRFLKR